MPHISFSNVPEPLLEPPDTPRSVLACRKAGIDPSLLLYKQKAQLSNNPKIADFLFEEVEKDRYDMISDCKEEYGKVLQGITEAEFELMGRPTALAGLVPPKYTEILSSSKRQELIARKQAEIAVAEERFLKVYEFYTMKMQEREEKNREIEKRILQRYKEEQEHYRQMVQQYAERTAKAELERAYREQEHYTELDRIKYLSDERLKQLESRLQMFKEYVQRENDYKAQVRSEKMLKSKNYYDYLYKEKAQRAEAKRQLEEQRTMEREKYLELNVAYTRERIQTREKRIKYNVNEKMKELDRKTQEFGAELEYRCTEHDINQQNQVTYVRKKFGDKNLKNARRTEMLLESFKMSQIEQQRYIYTKEIEYRKKYDGYQNEVLIDGKLKHEKYKLEEERGRIRAMRLQQQQEYYRKFKEAQLKLRFYKVEENLQAREAEKLYVQYYNSKFEAQRQKLEYEKYYGQNGVKRSPSPSEPRASLRATTNYSPSSASAMRTKSPTREQQRMRQQEDIEALIRYEQLRERERKEQLAGVYSDEERVSLMKRFTAERYRNADKIKELNAQNRIQIGY